MRNTNVGSDLARLEPPDIALCTWCDGDGKVEVASVRTCTGVVVEVTGMWGNMAKTIDCPRCAGSGAEPQDPEPHNLRQWRERGEP